MKLPQRSSGVLLPVFSLRSAHDVGVGDFEAFERLFAWLQQASQRVLMVLPLVKYVLLRLASRGSLSLGWSIVH